MSAKQTPLPDLLDRVPEDIVLGIPGDEPMFPSYTNIPIGRLARQAAAELRRLHAENFALAAGQCMNVVGDEGGTPMCFKAQQLQAARERDNVSFKQLLAQRDALLEALHLAADFLEHSTEFRIGRPGFEQAQAKARAAIKAVEEGK